MVQALAIGLRRLPRSSRSTRLGLTKLRVTKWATTPAKMRLVLCLIVSVLLANMAAPTLGRKEGEPIWISSTSYALDYKKISLLLHSGVALGVGLRQRPVKVGCVA